MSFAVKYGPPEVRTFSPCEVASRCGLSIRTVLAAIHSGDLIAMKVNARVIRVSEDDLARWIAACRERAQRMRTV